jgi:hypothetical protein
MTASMLIFLPSLHIFATLSGARARLADVVGLEAGFVALASVLLIGFAPVAWVFSESTESATVIGGIHLAFWLVCLGFGFRFPWAGLELFQMKLGRGFGAWIVIFSLVSLRMTCSLRPIAGASDSFLPKRKLFFAEYWGRCLENGDSAEADRAATPK